MDSNDYFVLELENVAADIEDLLTGDLFAIGAQGVLENLEFTQLNRDYKPSIIEREVKNLVAYFLEAPNDLEIQNILKSYHGIKITLNKQPILDWLSEWKKNWRPFELINNIWIVPDWEKEQFQTTADKQAIYIEPGMAFGTGTHETTQLAAYLMDEILRKYKINTLVDVGTGSGILALLGQKYNLTNIFAYDNDEESKRVFIENMEKNNIKNYSWCKDWSSELSEKVDLTVANIIDGVLLDLKDKFQEIKSPYYIFTGILQEREKAFLSEMLSDWPLKLITRIQKGDWVGLSFEAPKA
jgi:ribosomal protein L11 methyltransferase